MKTAFRIVAIVAAIYLVPAGFLLGNVIVHRSTWFGHNIHNYTATIKTIDLTRTYQNTTIETVRDGKSSDALASSTWIEQQFDRAHDCALLWPIRYIIFGCTVVYQTEYGYPSLVEYDGRRFAENEYYSFEIKNLTPEPTPAH